MKAFTTASLLILMARGISAVPHPAPAPAPAPAAKPDLFFPEDILVPLGIAAFLLRPTGSSSSSASASRASSSTTSSSRATTPTPLAFNLAGIAHRDTAPVLDARAGKSDTAFTSTSTSTSTFTDGAAEYGKPLPISPASPSPLPFQPGGPVRNLTTVRLMKKPEEAVQPVNITSSSSIRPVLTSTITVSTTSTVTTTRTSSASSTAPRPTLIGTGTVPLSTGLPFIPINPLDPTSVVLGGITNTLNVLLQGANAVQDIQSYVNQLTSLLTQIRKREFEQRQVLQK